MESKGRCKRRSYNDADKALYVLMGITLVTMIAQTALMFVDPF